MIQNQTAENALFTALSAIFLFELSCNFGIKDMKMRFETRGGAKEKIKLYEKLNLIQKR